MQVISYIMQAIGSLGFILYGMKLMSEGIQKSAGDRLHNILNMMTGNRFRAVLTGVAVTAIVQSSSATTVMTVSFVNAGILSLRQAIGVIFGANIGTTITAWIVSIAGFSFKLTKIAIPVFGIGFLLTFFKRFKKETLGEALMGFGLLFMGLSILSKVAPYLKPSDFEFLGFVTGTGIITVLSGVLLAYNNVIGWEFSAAAVLGCNVGTTIDALIASIGTKLNARRAAAVHVFFNIGGTLIALILFRPFLYLVNSLFLTGSIIDNIPTRISLFHTLFNVLNTLIALPFVSHIATLVEKLIPEKNNEETGKYHLVLPEGLMGDRANSEAYILEAEREINAMSLLVCEMFDMSRHLFDEDQKDSYEEIVKKLGEKEDYADQMQEELSRYLIETARLSLSTKAENNVWLLLTIVDDLENMTDQIYILALHIEKSIKKNMNMNKDSMDKLLPYMGIVNQFIHFVHGHLNQPLAPDQLALAKETEDNIDAMRTKLKKLARNRLEEGADVRSELIYIDMVRAIERIGDSAFSISEALSKTL